jgi:hypothetical protein
LYELQ